MISVFRIPVLALLLVGIAARAPAQQIGNCEYGQAKQYIDINGVKASVYNTGGLFYRGPPSEFEAPAGSGASPIYAANLWIGGLVDGELHMTASDYGPWEMWPGPLDDSGAPPEDCSEFDRIYRVSRYELREFDQTGIPTKDIADWPWQLGAPVEDGDGDPNNYDLEAGDRPKIEGDQMLWWVMNDVGNEHAWSLTDPMGIEVQTAVFASSSLDADLNYTTVYRYTLINKSPNDIEQTYFGMWVDPDLGYSGDDYLGSDTTEGVVYVWNGDDFDESSDFRTGYGDHPPALGFTIIDGPRVAGKVGITNFLHYGSDSTVQGNPDAGDDAYRYLRSLWRDDSPVTYGGTGRGFSETPAKMMYPGRPPEFWSEEDTDDVGSRNTPSERRIVWSTGPFDLTAGDSVEIVMAIIFAQGEDRFDSVYGLLDAVPRVKEAVAEGLETSRFPRPQGAPGLISPGDNVGSQPTNLTLTWVESPYADRYEIEIGSSDSLIVKEQISARPMPVPAPTAELTFEPNLPGSAEFTWRVRGLNASGYGPWSELRTFSTSSIELTGPGPLTIEGMPDGSPAFVQIRGIGDDDACGPLAGSTFGCAEVGGNFVYGSFNGQGDWLMYHRGAGPEESIGAFAPNDFEIRVTHEPSYGYFIFSSGNIIEVPLEAWDIGDVGPFGVNDTTDDVRLIPIIFSDSGGECSFAFGEGDDPFGLGWQMTDRVYAYYPTSGSSYSDWESAARPLVEQHPSGCPTSPETDSASNLIDRDRGRPLQRLTFTMDPSSANYRPEMIPVGNVIRFYTTRPVPPQQSAPAPETVVSPPFTLYWQTDPATDSSRVQLLNVGQSLEVKVDRFGFGGRLTIDDLESGLYYWRLSNGGDEWSDPWSLIVLPSTAAEDDGLGLPTVLELKPPYPNPSDGPRSLVYGVPGPQRVSLAVYDLLGRRVEALSDRDQTAGWHTERWDPKSLSAGVYFIRLSSESGSSTQPVVITN